VWLYADGGAVAMLLGCGLPGKASGEKRIGDAVAGLRTDRRGPLKRDTAVAFGTGLAFETPKPNPNLSTSDGSVRGEHAARVANGHDVRRIDVVGHNRAAVDDHHGRERAR